jgi:hypothetical protein
MSPPEWSRWVPFAQVLSLAPRLPGVYMAREGEHGDVVYVGMAGERSGGGRPQGLHGRLRIYASGKGLASGLGEAVFDRALADADWVRAQLVRLEVHGPRRAKHWGIEAFSRADLYLCWTVTADANTARDLEGSLVKGATVALWNKACAGSVRTVLPKAESQRTSSVLVRPASVAASDPLTQRIAAGDLASGQIRIPIAHKHMFPMESSQLSVLLKGELMCCSWNPQTVGGKQRSGRLRLPAEALRKVVAADERLPMVFHRGTTRPRLEAGLRAGPASLSCE